MLHHARVIHPAPVISTVLAALVLLVSPATGQATINVTTTVDENVSNSACSLREAVNLAATDTPNVSGCTDAPEQGADTIVLPAGTYELIGATGENFNNGGDLDIQNLGANGDLTIKGAGDGPGGTVINGHDSDRAFDIQADSSAGLDFTLEDVTVTNGLAHSSTPGIDGDGGAVLMRDPDGTVTVRRATIDTNMATRWGGAISFSNSTNCDAPSLSVIDSQLTANSSGGRGGAIYTKNCGSWDYAQVIRSTLAGNHASRGGAIYLATDVATVSQLLVVDSTLSGNQANDGGAAIGIGAGHSITNVAFSTIAGNHTAGTPRGGAIQTDSDTQEVNLFGTILAANTDSAGTRNCAEVAGTGADGVFSAATTSYDLEDANTCDLVTAAPSFDLVNATAGLAGLADNGGPTLTRALTNGSQALNRVPRTPADLCDPRMPDVPAAFDDRPVNGIDQRGVARPTGAGATCDIGAYESPIGWDTDEDGVRDGADNCPTVANADQADADGDSLGDACDATDDSHGGGGGTDPGGGASGGDAGGAGSASGDGGGDGSAGGSSDPCATTGVCPAAEGTLTLGYSARKQRFKGALASSLAACTPGRAVTIVRRRKGLDLRVGEAITDAAGRFGLSRRAKRGRYYAAVDATPGAGTTDCLAARSPDVKVRAGR